MANAQWCPSAYKEVLDVEIKCPYLPLTPTYDQYVQRWVVMPEREGFHLKTLEKRHSLPRVCGRLSYSRNQRQKSLP
jgi:hypothetical protein